MVHQNDDRVTEIDENLLDQEQKVSLINSVTKITIEEQERTEPCHIRSENKCGKVQQRWILAVMGCLAVTNAYTMRICLSLAITEMVTKTKTSSNDSRSSSACPLSAVETTSSLSSGGTYEWDEYTQGIILSSFYWGYICIQLPGGIIAEKFGGKHTLGLGILTTAIFSLVTPIVVEAYEATGLIVLRVLMGFWEGPTFPALSVLIAQWAPPLERSIITSVIMSGMAIGTIIGNGLTGILIQASSMGWPVVFYFYGGLGVLWYFVWAVLCYSYPEDHPFISEREKKYIQEATIEHTHRETGPTPWLYIASSIPVWGLILGKAGFSWGFSIMLNDLPKYMSSVLNFSIQANGLLSALPYLVMCIVSTTSSWLVDWLIKTEKISRARVRKIYHTFCSVIPAVFIIAASYAGCDRTTVVILFTVGVGAMGTYCSTVMVNPNDLSPNNAGILMAIVNAVGALAGILAPYVVGVLTPNQTLSEWRTVFWITFASLLASSLVFNLWADGEVQYWNDLDPWKNQRKQYQSKNQKKCTSDALDQPPQNP